MEGDSGDDQQTSKPPNDSDQSTAVAEVEAKPMDESDQSAAVTEDVAAAEAEVIEKQAQKPASPAQASQCADAPSLLDLECEMEDPTELLKPTLVILPSQAEVSSGAKDTESSLIADSEMAPLPSPEALKTKPEPAPFGPAAKARPSPLKLTSVTETAEEPTGTECEMEISPLRLPTSGLSTEASLGIKGAESSSTADSKMAPLQSPVLKTKAEPEPFGPAAKARPSPLKLTSVTETAEESPDTECEMEISPSIPSTSGLSTVKSKRPRGRLSPEDESVTASSQVPVAKAPKPSTSPDSESSLSAEAALAVAAYAASRARDRPERPERPERPCADAEFTYSELSDSASPFRTPVSASSEQMTSEVVSSGVYTYDSEAEDTTTDESRASPPILIAGPPSSSSEVPTPSEIMDSYASSTTNGCVRPGDPNESPVPLPSPASLSGSSSSLTSPRMPPSWDPARRPLIRRPIPLYPSASTSTSASPDVPPSTSAGVPRSVSYPGALPPGQDLPYAYTLTPTELLPRPSGDNTASESGILLPPPPRPSGQRHPTSVRQPSTTEPSPPPRRLPEAPFEAGLQVEVTLEATAPRADADKQEAVAELPGGPTEEHVAPGPSEQRVLRHLSGLSSQEESSQPTTSGGRSSQVFASSMEGGVCATFNVSGVSESSTTSEVPGSTSGRQDESSPLEDISQSPAAEPATSQGSVAHPHRADHGRQSLPNVVDIVHGRAGGIEQYEGDLDRFTTDVIRPRSLDEPSIQAPAQPTPRSRSLDDGAGTSGTSAGSGTSSSQQTSTDQPASSADRSEPSSDMPGLSGDDSNGEK